MPTKAATHPVTVWLTNMKILIALAEPLPPQASGGSQKVASEIAGLLMRDGNKVALAGRILPKQRFGLSPTLKAIRARKLFHYEPLEISKFSFFRGVKGFSQVLDHFKPDVIVMNTMSAMPMANLAASQGIILMLYWHDVEFYKLDGFPPMGAMHIANSQFTAMRLEQRFGLAATVIPPIFSRLLDSVPDQGTHDRVLFINPVADKGLDRVLEIARACPDLVFEMVESWVTGKHEQEALRNRLAALPNVILTPRQTDMVPVYKRAWILLAPSRWEEAWGRVVSEAQSYDVPVLATRIGGLSESVNSGGLLFSPSAGPSEWVNSINHLRRNKKAYDDLVRATQTAARRPEVDPNRNIQLLRDAIGIAMNNTEVF